MNGNIKRESYDAIYFDSFGAEYIPKEINKFVEKQKYNKKYLQNIEIHISLGILLYWIY